jgi:hypothetical protein
MLQAQGVMDLLLELNVRGGFRQAWGWLGGITSLRYLVNSFDGFPTAASVVLNEILRSNDCAGSTVRRGGYLVAVLIHKKPAGLVPV